MHPQIGFGKISTRQVGFVKQRAGEVRAAQVGPFGIDKIQIASSEIDSR